MCLYTLFCLWCFLTVVELDYVKCGVRYEQCYKNEAREKMTSPAWNKPLPDLEGTCSWDKDETRSNESQQVMICVPEYYTVLINNQFIISKSNHEEFVFSFISRAHVAGFVYRSCIGTAQVHQDCQISNLALCYVQHYIILRMNRSTQSMVSIYLWFKHESGINLKF